MNEYKLIDACRIGNLQLIKSFVEQGSNISVNEYAPLRNAALNGHLEVIKYLVERGSDISVNEYEPLRRAIWKGHLEVVRYLRKIAGNKLKCNKCIVAATCMKFCEGFIK